MHNKLQSLLQIIMKVGGILSEKESANFLLGKVGNPYITLYVNHVARKNNGNRRAKHAIVPDIHAINFPAGKQSINDRGSSRAAEAIFEVKTFTACKSRYAHNTIKTAPVDRRVRMIVSSYSRKCKTLDVKFAADTVGDGKGDIKGQFETAQ